MIIEAFDDTPDSMHKYAPLAAMALRIMHPTPFDKLPSSEEIAAYRRYRLIDSGQILAY